jgi:hypothetical protein
MELSQKQEAEVKAYYTGKWDAQVGQACRFTEENLVTAWKQGVRDFRSEARLNADTEWDHD